MLETLHALAGMAVMAVAPSPAFGLAAAFLSHFVLDTIPHWNWRPDARPLSLLGIAVDLIVAWALVLFFVNSSRLGWYLGSAAFAAILPDLLEAPKVFFGYENRFIRLLHSCQDRLHFRVGVVPGLITQLFVMAILVRFLLSA